MSSPWEGGRAQWRSAEAIVRETRESIMFLITALSGASRDRTRVFFCANFVRVGLLACAFRTDRRPKHQRTNPPTQHAHTHTHELMIITSLAGRACHRRPSFTTTEQVSIRSGGSSFEYPLACCGGYSTLLHLIDSIKTECGCHKSWLCWLVRSWTLMT
jgi:hypothetical protein